MWTESGGGKPAAWLLVLILVLSPVLAHADTYAPFTNFRAVDATGKYYIVVKKDGGPTDPGSGTPVTFEIAERRPGSTRLSEVSDQVRDLRNVVVNPEVTVRDGDILLGRGASRGARGRS